MSSGASISLEIIKDPGFDMMAYAVILAEKRISIDLPSGKMTTIH